MTFEEALSAVKSGRRAARREWKNALYVGLERDGASDVRAVEYLPFFYVRTLSGALSVWTPSTQDLLAADWYLVESK